MTVTSTNARMVGRTLPTAPSTRTPVVYLAGSGHTGSTLLAMLADVHPAIASVGEIAVKPKIRRRGDGETQKCSCGAVIVECPFWKDVFERVTRQGLDFDARSWSNDYRFENPVLHRVLSRDSSYTSLRRARRWAEEHLPIYRRRIRATDRVNIAFVRAVLDATGATVFFDTSKGTARLARLLAIREFDVKVVTLVRDVRAYAASARRRGKSLTDAAGTWRKDQLAIRELVEPLAPEQRARIRYEDLCEDPAATLKRLWSFCGVVPMDPPTRVFSSEHHVLGNNMRMAGPIEVRLDQRWRRDLAPAEQAAVLRVAGSLHRDFGYGT
jgi:hypothetical protein